MLELCPIRLNEEYRKKWNVHENDFVHLCKDGIKVNDSLYRVGGFGANLQNDYFMLIKHIEEYYEDNITKNESEKPHLAGHFCIIDKNGIEKVVFKQFDSPYLSGGVIYSLDRKYYNIETGEFYCQSYSHMNTKEFIFLNNEFDNDKSKRGVMKINKSDGTWELFK